MNNLYANRIEAVRDFMKDKGWDAIVITGSDPHNSEYPAPRWKQVEWLSGFTGEAGDIVITLGHAGLWTDTRYFIQAEIQLRDTGIALHKTRVQEQILIPDWLEENLDDNAAIAVDGLCQSAAAIEEIKGSFRKNGKTCLIVDEPDMLDFIWTDRPGIPSSPIMTIGEDIVGESRPERISGVRKFLMDKNLDAILISALDEIAWVMNIRGSDIEYNPVVISYLLISMDTVKWFVKKDTVADSDTADSFYELKADGVEIMDYEELDFSLYNLSEDKDIGRLFIDKVTLNYDIYRILKEDVQDTEIVEGTSPVGLMKAVKNRTEISGMKESHFDDGLAMEKFCHWLETSVRNGDYVTEWDAAAKLDSLRAEIPGYRGNSFRTISAYGKNAALPHYSTPETGSAKLEPHGLYLTDSGGQYAIGTTDITRTLPLGPCTQLEMEDYTLVLKGMIRLAMAVFPEGTAGCQLDALARNPLWRHERDFGHGTGHGVGFYLCVHEGPQDIRQNFNRQAFLPGMITSDEPGIYREGYYGIRHENLLLCKESGSNEFGHWLKFETLTLCHIDTSVIVKELMDKCELDWLNRYNSNVYEKLSSVLPEETAAWLRKKTQPIG
ncbi:MAG: aminopeptidase P family protein [Bacteroidales bacterium]|jgi:Xaa-Pro aminopeptidase|nr:aminopeptidase P family protein [Bacteroidales bacterium]MCI1784961.1 aminopeptidase P family protein [Bacteroidales bacterium]